MAVVPMQKVQLITHRADAEAALKCVQRMGAMQFLTAQTHDGASNNSNATTAIFPYADLLPRVQHAVVFLQPYAAHKSLWQTLRDGTRHELTETQLAHFLREIDVVADVVTDLERLQVEFADATEVVRSLEEQYVALEAWQALPFNLSQLQTTTTSTKLIHTTTAVEGEPLAPRLEAALAAADVVAVVTPVSSHAAAVTVQHSEVATIETCVTSLQAEIVAPPAGTATPAVEFVRVSDELAKARGAVALLHDQAEHFAITYLKKLQIASETLAWQRDRFTTLQAGASSAYTVQLTGWLNANKRVALETMFAREYLAATFAELPVEPTDEPPVEIENSPLVQPFEAVTRLYGMPGYRDLDPTVFLAGFFFLFFGLSLTDVGYGLVLMALSAGILFFTKVAKPLKLMAKLLLMVGFATVLVGLLFGGYLGIDPSLLPASLQALQLFDPIGNPLPVFYLALGLGVVQVMTGMVLKIVSESRNGRLLDGVLDQGPWLLVFSLAILYLATTLEYVAFIAPAQIINLLYVGFVLIVVSSGRKGETLLGKVQSSAASLYDSIGYFSDILSYSRLLALGLATTALAFAVNLIADIVREAVPYVGIVFAVLILIVGHLFTLAVNTLGAFIHSARLQFVEFFGKFIAGTGKEFTPLARSETYITISDD